MRTTRPEYIITYLAAMRCGGVPACFNGQYDAPGGRRWPAGDRCSLVLQADGRPLAALPVTLTSVRHLVIIGDAMTHADGVADGAHLLTDLMTARLKLG
ncbi:hypothetical protein [Candidatus Amarolinea dominans]|uniref:hypothetical protein n=1 Tax=Candidatus Amarolinea dominans TaxID=3140696 RepID=UPI001D2CEAEF|nr:hypothetical protein [Anaerolineae bacterium]